MLLTPIQADALNNAKRWKNDVNALETSPSADV